MKSLHIILLVFLLHHSFNCYITLILEAPTIIQHGTTIRYVLLYISTIHYFSIISQSISLCSQECKVICFSFQTTAHHTILYFIIYPQTSIHPWQSHPSMNATYPTFVVIILFYSFRSIPCDLVRLLVVSIEFLIYKVCILYV